jgi:hypothetical protein
LGRPAQLFATAITFARRRRHDWQEECPRLDGGIGVAKAGTCSWGRAGPNLLSWRGSAQDMIVFENVERPPLGWWRRAGGLWLHGGRCTLRCFLRGRACRAPRKVLGRQVSRLRLHHFSWGAVKGDALVMAQHCLAVRWRHFPAAEHAERVRIKTSPLPRQSNGRRRPRAV